WRSGSERVLGVWSFYRGYRPSGARADCVMACGATLKRSVGLEPLHGPPSPKRRRSSPLSGPGTPQPGQRCSLSAAAELHSSAGRKEGVGVRFLNLRPVYRQWRATLPLLLTTEKILHTFRQGYGQYQRRRQAEGGVVPSDSHGSGDERSPSPVLSSAPSSAPSSPTVVALTLGVPPAAGWVKKDQPFFTLRQVSYLCEHVLREREEALREEYDRVLNVKLAEQYEAFVKFTEDQIVRRYRERPASYVS
ncbi:hypothetical protein NFI96_023412, partial [Prochilodus magdalenae]